MVHFQEDSILKIRKGQKMMNSNQFNIGDRYELKYLGNQYPYVVKRINNRLYLTHDSKTPLGTPLTSIPIEEYETYNKEYGFKKEM